MQQVTTVLIGGSAAPFAFLKHHNDHQFGSSIGVPCAEAMPSATSRSPPTSPSSIAAAPSHPATGKFPGHQVSDHFVFQLLQSSKPPLNLLPYQRHDSVTRLQGVVKYQPLHDEAETSVLLA
jgi:hypothetical protein